MPASRLHSAWRIRHCNSTTQATETSSGHGPASCARAAPTTECSSSSLDSLEYNQVRARFFLSFSGSLVSLFPFIPTAVALLGARCQHWPLLASFDAGRFATDRRAIRLRAASEKSKRRTRALASTLEPRWNQTFLYSHLRRSELRSRFLEITVWDSDRLDTGRLIGEVTPQR